MEKKDYKKNPVWSFFKSIKLTFVLLILLAISSILGTFIPQGQDAMRFAIKIGPILFKIFNALELFDLYHSLWFRVLIGFLSINLIVCSLDRFPRTLKLVRKTPSPQRIKIFENNAKHRQITHNLDINTAKDISLEVLKSRFSSIFEKETPQGIFLFGEKGKYSAFGVYIVHLSVLIILVGAIIGSLWGFEAFVNIEEGTQADTIFLRKNHSPKKLNFSIRCEKFEVEFYKNGTPKEYRSHLSFIKNGSIIKKGVLRVNHPMEFQGITFYQASYGNIPGSSAVITLRKNNEMEKVISLKKGKPVPIPGSSAFVELLDIRDSFMNLGPAVLLRITRGDNSKRMWLFKHEKMIKERIPGLFERFETLNPSSFKPYHLSLKDFETKYYTGLQANKDPGVPVVWAGFLLIVIGCILTFFTSHQRVWIWIYPEGPGANIKVAGSTNKNPIALERELDRISSAISNKIIKR